MTLSIGGFSRVVTFPTASIATGRSDLAGRDLHPLKNCAFPRHTLIRDLPGDRLSCHRRPADWKALSGPVGPDNASARLDTSAEVPGPHDFTVRLQRRSSSRAGNRSRRAIRPAIPSHAQRCRVHRTPSRVRDDRDTPLLVGRDGRKYRSDLGILKTRIFLQKGLDTTCAEQPVGQITPFRFCASRRLIRFHGRLRLRCEPPC